MRGVMPGSMRQPFFLVRILIVTAAIMAVASPASAGVLVDISDPDPAMEPGVISRVDIEANGSGTDTIAGFDFTISFSASVPIVIVNDTTLPSGLDPSNPDWEYDETAITIFAPLSDRAPPLAGVSTLGADYFSGQGDDGIFKLANEFSSSFVLHLAYIYQSSVNTSPLSSGVLASVYFYTGSHVPANTNIAASFVTSQYPALAGFDGIEIPVDGFSGMTAATGTSSINAADDTIAVDEDNEVVVDPLLNDSGSPPLAIVSFTQPAHGTVTDNGDDTLTYAPGPDYSGVDSFTYTAADAQSGTDSAQVGITVNPINDPPVTDAGNDQAVSEQAVAVLDGSGSSDIDDTALTYLWARVSGPEVVLSDTSAVSPMFNAPDVGPVGAVLVFSLTVTDPGGASSSDTVSVTVNWINEPPVPADDTAVTDEDGQVMIVPLANDSDPDGQAISLAAFAPPAHGMVTDNGDDTLTYVPEADFNGTDTFTYTIYDGALESDPARVVITVNPVNDPPVADAGPAQTVGEQAEAAIDGTNSHDIDDTILTYFWEQTSGTKVLLSDTAIAAPTFTTPDVGVGGEALVFRLTVTDPAGATGTDTVIVNVTWSNEPPTADAGPDQTVSENTAVSLDGSGSIDPDDGIAGYLWEQTDGPDVSLSDVTDANPEFTAPDVGTNGASIGFDLTVTDAGGLKSTDHVIVNITWSNEPPVADAGPDQIVDEQTVVILDGSASTDPDDGIVAYLWTQAAGPAVTFSDPTAVSPMFVAPDVGLGGAVLEFELSVTDAGGLLSSDTVLVTLNWINAPPLANNDTATVDEDGRVNIYPLENDDDPDGQAISIAGFSMPSNGALTKNGDDTFTYEPDPDFNGADSFTYYITDGELESGSARVDITINPVNDPPAANDITVGTRNDKPASVHLDATDVDSDPLAYTLTDPENGTISGTPPDVVYTADRGFFGTDTFTYTADDGVLFSDNAIVTINVTENFPALVPQPLSPSDGAVIASTDVLLTVGPYTDPEGDSHVATHWKIWRKDRPGTSLYDFRETSDDLFSKMIADLVSGFAYEWTAGFEDAGSGHISWSSVRYFIIGPPRFRSDHVPGGLGMADYRMISFTQWFSNPSAISVLGLTGHARDYRFGTYDPVIGEYIFYGPDLEILPGRSYWVLFRHGARLSLEGVDVSVSSDKSVDVPLSYNPDTGNGWNMIAPPNDMIYVWSSIELVVNGESRGIVGDPGDNNQYIDPRLWYWRSGQYNDDGVILRPHGGYWVRVQTSGLSLRFGRSARYSITKNPAVTLVAGAAQGTALVRRLFTPRSATADAGQSPPLPMAPFEADGSSSGSGGCMISTIADGSGVPSWPWWIFMLAAAGFGFFIHKRGRA